MSIMLKAFGGGHHIEETMMNGSRAWNRGDTPMEHGWQDIVIPGSLDLIEAERRESTVCFSTDQIRAETDWI